MCNSSAESNSSRFATSRNHIRYLNGTNLVPFLYVRTIFMNLRSSIREEHKAYDLEYQDIICSRTRSSL